MAVRLKGDWEGLILDNNLGQNGLMLLSHLFQRPLVNINLVASLLGSTFPTASRLVSGFEEIGLLHEITGQKRSRMFRYEPYLALFKDAIGDDETAGAEPSDVTEASV